MSVCPSLLFASWSWWYLAHHARTFSTVDQVGTVQSVKIKVTKLALLCIDPYTDRWRCYGHFRIWKVQCWPLCVKERWLSNWLRVVGKKEIRRTEEQCLYTSWRARCQKMAALTSKKSYPIAAKICGPGPAAYLLPSAIGWDQHIVTLKRWPCYSMRMQLKIRTWVLAITLTYIATSTLCHF